MPGNTVVLTVTYGKRAQYIDKMVSQLVADRNVLRIVLVDNGSDNIPRLDQIARHFASKVIIIHTGKNAGSAVGFASGLQYVFRNLRMAEYIWLLDDDNLPAAGCLDTLLNYYKDDSTGDSIYSAFREDRRELLTSGDNHYISNSFFGFDLKMKLKLRKRRVSNKRRNNLILCDTVPYGGLLLPFKVAEKNGLPDTRYVLYNDDNDYTYRLTKSGLHLYVCVDALIHDQESSWYRREKVPMFQGFFNTDMLRNAVYTVRNRTYFEKNNIVTNNILYSLNIGVYLSYVFLFYMPKTKNGLKRFLLIKRMIKKGLQGELGPLKSDEYEYAVR
ncbi:glycosyltransferase [Lacticaseibacillus rhamnosus]|uniref:glycosyltransferase n=1 Tax=Lacticaseibacillus rhamnosus TaxID=47715 RepID=UPI000532C25A|nr:glycosyltransferase [Lacticaseibacillus rhamnosus]